MSKEPPAEDPLVIVPVPALVAVLLAMEEKKGSPLTQAEVLRIRDDAHSIVMPASIVRELAAERGYTDIDPENAWEEWGQFRSGLQS
ncbi:hypothetical protein ACHMW4_12365 [Mesorhizobium sp. UC22_110]|uniref:hypothetical protein n=1 Tax=unclassified Mesorhizobium TaxID=325217 RepID=UPI0036718100